MGNLLGAPVTEKETHSGETESGLEYAVSSMQGWRVHMEDAHITEPSLYAEESGLKLDLPEHSLFAVFDGHGGTFAAIYSGNNLCRVLCRQPKFIEYAKFELDRAKVAETMKTDEEREKFLQNGLDFLKEALTDAFVELDREIASALHNQPVPDADKPYRGDSVVHSAPIPAHTEVANTDNPADAALRILEEEGDSGTTACVVVITPLWIVCANAGDSRAVMARSGLKTDPLSYDHKPDNEAEERRIRAAGGYVAGGRVEGDLAVSRGLGDFRFKNHQVVMSAGRLTDTSQPVMEPGDQKVSPIPEFSVQNRNEAEDEFVLVACDGIWDVQESPEAVWCVGEMFKEGETDLGLICEEVRCFWINFLLDTRTYTIVDLRYLLE